MTTAEFRRQLVALGASFKEGSKHTKIYINGHQSTLPRHAGDIPFGTLRAIIKQLNLEEYFK